MFCGLKSGALALNIACFPLFFVAAITDRWIVWPSIPANLGLLRYCNRNDCFFLTGYAGILGFAGMIDGTVLLGNLAKEVVGASYYSWSYASGWLGVVFAFGAGALSLYIYRIEPKDPVDETQVSKPPENWQPEVPKFQPPNADWQPQPPVWQLPPGEGSQPGSGQPQHFTWRPNQGVPQAQQTPWQPLQPHQLAPQPQQGEMQPQHIKLHLQQQDIQPQQTVYPYHQGEIKPPEAVGVPHPGELEAREPESQFQPDGIQADQTTSQVQQEGI